MIDETDIESSINCFYCVLCSLMTCLCFTLTCNYCAKISGKAKQKQFNLVILTYIPFNTVANINAAIKLEIMPFHVLRNVRNVGL